HHPMMPVFGRRDENSMDRLVVQELLVIAICLRRRTLRLRGRREPALQVRLVTIADCSDSKRLVLLKHAHHKRPAAAGADHAERDLVGRRRLRSHNPGGGKKERAAIQWHGYMISRGETHMISRREWMAGALAA